MRSRLHSIAVFLGPSLGSKEALELLDADYFPPARKGDIYRIMATGVKTIVLVDGVFHNTPSVWPREILSALEEDIQVIGAASMGALRAAELHQFGMVGYGTVFEWYRSGVIEGDDEVAVSHASAEFGFRPMSEALVNIRHTLDRAIADHCLPAKECHQLLDYAKQLYYPERSYQKLLSSPVVNRWPEDDRAMIRDYFLTRGVNLKMEDAIGVLRQVAQMKRSCVSRSTDPGRSQKDLWQVDRSRMGGFVGTEDILTGETVLQEVRKNPELVASIWRTLSQRCFLLEWATQNNISLPDKSLNEYIERWEAYQGIDDNGNALRANGLTRNFYKKLLAQRALLDWITANGPAHFDIVWDFEQAFRQESRLLGRTAEPDLNVQVPPVIQSPLLGREQNDAAHAWIELSQRRFVLEWARQNGVSCPSGPLQAYREHWERTHPVSHRAATEQSDGLSVVEYNELLVERALVDWITAQGPNHFGLLWAFDDALLRELQISGRAAQLLENRQRS